MRISVTLTDGPITKRMEFSAATLSYARSTVVALTALKKVSKPFQYGFEGWKSSEGGSRTDAAVTESNAKAAPSNTGL
jgi:hypothetical protein